MNQFLNNELFLDLDPIFDLDFDFNRNPELLLNFEVNLNLGLCIFFYLDFPGLIYFMRKNVPPHLIAS